MDFEAFNVLFWRVFPTIKAGAELFHVQPAPVRRWLSGLIPINPMAEKLLIIKSLGYLPNNVRWRGFHIDEARAVLITPSRREFSPKELESFAYQKVEYQQFLEQYERPQSPKHYPAKENVYPFKGCRRMTAAPWIQSKLK